MYKQLIIARKDLGMSPGKLAAQVAHGSMAFLSWMVRDNASCCDPHKHPVYGRTPYIAYNNRNQPLMDFPGDMVDENGALLYRRGDLYDLAKAAAARGEKYFYCKSSVPDDRYGPMVECDPEPRYDIHFSIDADLMEQWIQGAFTKVVCEAKSREKLLKAVTIAKENGMVEGVDYFLIRDNCLTELTPEDEDGRTLTVIGFKPMPAEKIDVVGKKFQLWR